MHYKPWDPMQKKNCTQKSARVCVFFCAVVFSVDKMSEDCVYIRQAWLNEGVAGTLADVRDIRRVLVQPSKCSTFGLGD